MLHNKVIHPCDVPVWNGKKYPLFCKINFSSDGRLSITGVVGPLKSGNAMGGCGQVDMEFYHPDVRDDTSLLKPVQLRWGAGWNRAKWYKFLKIWNDWHLNDMKSTCIHQEEMGWAYDTHHGNAWHYDITKEPDEEGEYPIVKDPYKGDACPVCGYEIGSAWQKREVPADVIEFLSSLPNTDRTPNWV